MRKTRDAADARAVRVEITDAGREQLHATRAARAAVLQGRLDRLDDEALAALAAALPALAEDLQATPSEVSLLFTSYFAMTGLSGAIAPFLAGKLAEHASAASPMYVGAGMVTLSVVALQVSRHHLRHRAVMPQAALT